VRDKLYTHFPVTTLEYLSRWSGLEYHVFRLLVHVLLASSFTCTNYTSSLLYLTLVAQGFYLGRWVILALALVSFLLSFLHHPWLNRKNESLGKVFSRARDELKTYFAWSAKNFRRDSVRVANHFILPAWLVLWGVVYIIVISSQDTLCGEYVEYLNLILKLGAFCLLFVWKSTLIVPFNQS